MRRLKIISVIAVSLLFSCSSIRAQSPADAAAKKKFIENLKETAYAGDVAAQVKLGIIYLTGDGAPRDDAEAAKWLRKAADQDNPMAERYLAEMYFKGRGVPADNEQAARLLQMAADQGEGQSEYNPAVLYTQGQGVARNAKQAALWMRRAAEQNLAAAQHGMGVILENGDGVPSDPVEAASWYRKAVNQSYVPAMNSLALLLATSYDRHVKNPEEAVAMATKAVAASNNPDYLDTLAAAYFANGDTDKAVETEQKALARKPDNEDYQKALQKYLGAAHGSR
jgi:TPR repeat protein